MKISLEKFIKNTKGTKVSVPWNSNLTGQCVSLIQQYIGQCLEQPMKARGNAKDWLNSYINEGLGYKVDIPRKGDILVYGSHMGGGLGHISIYIDNNTMYDQNNSSHDNLCAGYSKIFNDYSILRPNVELIEEPKPQKDIEEIVKEVISGIWGNGEIRKVNLTNAGYDYNSIQNKVNEMLNNKVSLKDINEIAKEVISGKWGNGTDRKQSLTQAGYDYNVVQNKVNEMLK